MFLRTNLLHATLIATISLCAQLSAQGTLTNPYNLLEKHFEAMGGIDKLKAEMTQYVEGALAVAGLQGTIKIWTQKPDKLRTDVDLKILKISQGESSDGKWVLDSNGKLQVITNFDEVETKRKEIKRRLAEYEYSDQNSTIFDVTLSGIEPLDGKDCYVLKISNSINSDVVTNYVDASTFLLSKSISMEGESSNESYFSDYRDVGGIQVAFHLRQIELETGQVQEIQIEKYESNPVLASSTFDPPKENEADFKFTNGFNSENVPFKFVRNHLYIPVTIAGFEKYWVLDTGAGMSVVSSELASNLGLTLQGEMIGKASNSTVNVQFTTLPSFGVKGIEFSSQTAAVIDMTELNQLLDIEIDGILGFDFLSRFVTKIDYANNLVSFYDPKTFEYSGDGKSLDVHIKNSVFTVPATLDDTISGNWLFDLGASSVSVEAGFAKKCGFAARKGIERMGRGAGQAFKSKLVQFEKIDFAGFTLEHPIVSFALESPDTAKITDQIGILGNTLFRNFVIYCDYSNEHLIIERGKNFGTRFPEDRSGIQLGRSNKGEIVVVFVAPDSPGAVTGFKNNDLIESIDGKSVADLMGLSGLRDIFSADTGTRYKVQVRRDNRKIELELELRELFN